MSAVFADLEGANRPGCFASHDPGRPVGSGGGAAHLLAEAWAADGRPGRFEEWLSLRPRLVVHSGGQSRRLPAYAACGKALMPIPIERGSVGQRFDQSLLDLQLKEMDDLFQRADERSILAIISGDALMRASGLPKRLPFADVTALGFEAPPEQAASFGVFLLPWSSPWQVESMLQKPSPFDLRRLESTHRCLVDAGVWFLSVPAVMALMEASGWDSQQQEFTFGVREYDLYGQFGPRLGSKPNSADKALSGLSLKVVAAGADFYHFGTNRQLVESVTRLQSAGLPVRSDLGFTTAARRRQNQHTQNSVLEGGLKCSPGAQVWVENCRIAAGSMFAGDNIVTGLPALPFELNLPSGVCLDFVPVGDDEWCVRVYGFDDAFKGQLGSKGTHWLGRPAASWFAARGIEPPDTAVDIQESPLFPVIRLESLSAARLEWLWSADSGDGAWWLAAQKLSAQQLAGLARMDRLAAQRAENRMESLVKALANHRHSIFLNSDLEHAAKLLAPSAMPSAHHPLAGDASSAQQLHERMFRSELMRLRGESGFEGCEADAFGVLQRVIVESPNLRCRPPLNQLLKDQIVWCRSPLRMDLAGGWTDTPPYALLYGGRVVNVAVELNGQPPVQVFGRVLPEHRIVLRSIDLGTEKRIESHEDLRADVAAHDEFSLAKTALALAGFTPQFNADHESSLARQLAEFGGGIELTMLAAVPKGSGLGTSSILSAAILSALSEMCGHGWSPQQVFDRVTASEQMLTTGGGWQDQAGGLLPGLKLLSTSPGIAQTIGCRWLPDNVLSAGIAEGRVLLYYTGITRVAKGVLKEIVRGMFLNSGPRLRTLEAIGANTEAAADAAQTRSYEALGSAIRQSWVLNQALDSGTNPPPVAELYAKVDDLVAGAKLLGAGGGGYMLMLAKDPEAALKIRTVLDQENPQAGARFVELAVSQRGLEVSRS